MKAIITQPYLILKGGAEEVVLRIAKHYDAKILTLEYDKGRTFEEFKDVDIEILNKKIPLSKMLPYRASQGMRAGYSFYYYKIKDDYDFLNAHTSPSEWIRHLNSRLLWYCHTPIREVYDLYTFRQKNRSYKEKLLYFSFTSAYKLLSKSVINKIEHIATNSNNTHDRIKKYFGRDATIINPGIDVKEFTNKGDGKYFLYHTRFYPNKRQDYVVEAFAKFQKKMKKQNYRLILSGSISNDKEHLAYVQKLKDMKVKNVVFKFNISEEEKRKLYANTTAMLFAAVNEDFGIVPLEAMASSKPVISVKEGGPMETIMDGKTGFLVDSTTQMAEKMKFLVEHKDIAEKMGKEARKHVEKNYSWEKFFEKFDKLAREVSKK